MNSHSRWVAPLVAPLMVSATALAQENSSAQLQELNQRIQVLERKLELQNEAAQTAASTPAIRAGTRGFSIATADGANTLRVRGTLHIDGRYFGDDLTPETSDTVILRRVRPTIEGTVGRIFDFRFQPDFAGGRAFLVDAYATARLKPWLALQAGRFKVPVGLERLQSASDIRFVERAYPTNLLPNRDLGVQITGDVHGGLFNYAIGYYNGVTDGSSSDSATPADAETDTVGDIAARVFFLPFVNSDAFAQRGLGFGIAGTYVDVVGSSATPNLSTYRTAGQQTLFQYRANNATGFNNATYANGVRKRISPQAYYYLGKFGVLAEYAEVEQDVSRQVSATTRVDDTLKTSAWHVQFAWFLTGEEQAFRGFTPASTFQVGKPGWGAFELVARAHSIRFDDDAFAGGANSFANPFGKVEKAGGALNPREATSYAAGVNWYFNEAVRWQVNYEVTRFEGGAANGGDQPDERALFTRVGVGF